MGRRNSKHGGNGSVDSASDVPIFDDEGDEIVKFERSEIVVRKTRQKAKSKKSLADQNISKTEKFLVPEDKEAKTRLKEKNLENRTRYGSGAFGYSKLSVPGEPSPPTTQMENSMFMVQPRDIIIMFTVPTRTTRDRAALIHSQGILEGAEIYQAAVDRVQASFLDLCHFFGLPNDPDRREPVLNSIHKVFDHSDSLITAESTTEAVDALVTLKCYIYHVMKTNKRIGNQIADLCKILHRSISHCVLACLLSVKKSWENDKTLETLAVIPLLHALRLPLKPESSINVVKLAVPLALAAGDIPAAETLCTRLLRFHNLGHISLPEYSKERIKRTIMAIHAPDVRERRSKDEKVSGSSVGVLGGSCPLCKALLPALSRRCQVCDVELAFSPMTFKLVEKSSLTRCPTCLTESETKFVRVGHARCQLCHFQLSPVGPNSCR
eukprot:GHVP01062782.1.p1 GENE.GHVP01062782.1~~GHVP01062782.1.p1  ORF type:complete len:485 (-),score=70.89 GHVP01062782.1:341-1654(-)